MKNNPVPAIEQTCKSIKTILEKARSKSFNAVNMAMVHAYWSIGRIIVEDEQKGKAKARYGEYLLINLAERLTEDFGKGFDESNLRYMRKFYIVFPIRDALRHELSWTHYRLLLKVENSDAREFYKIECADSHWSTRELERQINSLLFERLALSRDKKGVLELAKASEGVRLLRHEVERHIEQIVAEVWGEDKGQYNVC